MLEEIIKRSIKRGNNEKFTSEIKNVYYRDLPKNKERVIWLEKGKYLEDILIEKGIIE